MRRRVVLLSLALSASVTAATTPPAQAYPVCVRAYTESPRLPEVDTGQTCVGWPYGVYCQFHHYWDDNLSFDAHVDYCVPRVVVTETAVVTPTGSPRSASLSW